MNERSPTVALPDIAGPGGLGVRFAVLPTSAAARKTAARNCRTSGIFSRAGVAANTSTWRPFRHAAR